MAGQRGRPRKQPQEPEEPHIENEEPINEDDYDHNEQPEDEDEFTLEPIVVKAISDEVSKVLDDKLPALVTKILKDTLKDKSEGTKDITKEEEVKITGTKNGENRARNGVTDCPESRNEGKFQSMEFLDSSRNEDDSIDELATKLSKIVSKSNSLGSIIKDKTLVKKLLSSLPNKFITIVASIEQFADLSTMSFQEAIGRLKAFEERIKPKDQGSSSKGDQLMLSYEDWQARKRQEASKGIGRQARKRQEASKGIGRGSNKPTIRGRGRGRGNFGRGRGQDKGQSSYHQGQSSYHQKKLKDKTKVQCFRCNALGRYSTECPTRPRQEESNLAQANDEGAALMMTFGIETQAESVLLNDGNIHPRRYEEAEDDYWFLENGASNHMTSNKDLFTQLDSTITRRVRFGDGSYVEIKGRRSIIVECKTGEQRILTNVYLIPSLKSSIISLGQLTEVGYEIQMNGELLWVKEHDGTLLMKVPQTTNRIYKVRIKAAVPVCLQAKVESPAWLWHARLGHVRFDSLKLLTTKGLARGVPTINHPSQMCDGCSLGKQSRNSFPKQSQYQANHLLELVYVDVCRPITPTTKGGNRYMLLLVDDHSFYIWEFIIKSKDEVFGCLDRFKRNIEMETCCTIKKLRTDNGGDFTSRKLEELCNKVGIQHQYTSPYSPQQNRVVESRNRTVLNMTRSILKAMRLPQDFWAEGIRHSIHILNQMTTKALNNTTPYEILKGRKPNLEHIRVFGCIGYVKTLATDQKKLDDRSTKMVHLGT
ncbi:hypothetical protein E3N88_15490 [Mikania micrantha]|uniref:Integrase catalytic domain-containing protein n=1 Tax=Mikania micrantha TaxID=192012 RepID=A0A5N6NVI9_9ASTR|nr:hypothetical protein E3N88_15490 [Mikania micrantha]